MDLLVRRSFGLPRSWSNSILKQLGPFFNGEVINVSAWDDQDKEGGQYRSYFPNATAYYTSNYYGERGTDESLRTDFIIDLTQPLDAKLVSRFDTVFNHTTLEHIFDVDAAFRNLCQMSRDTVIAVVPFAQPLHYTSSFGDYWRFSPMVLRLLFQKNDFHVVYEAANHDPNAGVYLLFVGSRHPENWNTILPSYDTIQHLGDWIGNVRYRKIAKAVSLLLVKLHLVGESSE